MEITREWLDEISDERGLTKGHQELFSIWCKEPPYVGRLIPEHITRFMEKCKGFRGSVFSEVLS